LRLRLANKALGSRLKFALQAGNNFGQHRALAILLLHEPKLKQVAPGAPSIPVVTREHKPLRPLLELSDAIHQISV
jgi:hypothetical protein